MVGFSFSFLGEACTRCLIKVLKERGCSRTIMGTEVLLGGNNCDGWGMFTNSSYSVLAMVAAQ